MYFMFQNSNYMSWYKKIGNFCPNSLQATEPVV